MLTFIAIFSTAIQDTSNMSSLEFFLYVTTSFTAILLAFIKASTPSRVKYVYAYVTSEDEVERVRSKFLEHGCTNVVSIRYTTFETVYYYRLDSHIVSSTMDRTLIDFVKAYGVDIFDNDNN